MSPENLATRVVAFQLTLRIHAGEGGYGQVGGGGGPEVRGMVLARTPGESPSDRTGGACFAACTGVARAAGPGIADLMSSG
jgi:hypothetical protein